MGQTADTKHTINIVSRWDSSRVLFSHETTADRQASGLAMRDALEAAVKSGSDLRGSDLSGSDLRGSDLSGADLSGANLSDANLSGSDLRGSNLSRAYLSGANLSDANLSGAYLIGAYLIGAYLIGAYLIGAYLSGANLRGSDLSCANLRGSDLSSANLSCANLRGSDLSCAKVRGLALVGARPFLAIGPIGSESRTVFAWLTESGVRIQAGCFFGTRDEFTAQLAKTHGNNEHADEYRAALHLIDAHARIWTPAAEAAAA